VNVAPEDNPADDAKVAVPNEADVEKILADCALADAAWARLSPQMEPRRLAEAVASLAAYAKPLSDVCRRLVLAQQRLKDAIWPGLPAWQPTAEEPQQDFYLACAESFRHAIEKLQAFKDYVHRRLDEAGVPIDPDSPHRAEGCRVGGRLDVLLAAVEIGTAAAAEREKLRAALRDVLASLANYKRCHDDHSLSPYIRENGRHTGERRASPWGELVNDAAAAADLLPAAQS
jgi:hypothetical protein